METLGEWFGVDIVKAQGDMTGVSSLEMTQDQMDLARPCHFARASCLNPWIG